MTARPPKPTRPLFRCELFVGLLLATALLVAGPVGAEESSAAPPSPGSAAPELTPPSLKDHPGAPYPTEALRDKVEGNVGLELDVDAGGNVSGVRVTTPAGHGFDEAASETARTFTFEPARRRGVPVASTVQFTYEFHLPIEAPPPPPPAAAAPTPPPAPARCRPDARAGAGRRRGRPDRPRSVHAGARHEADQRGVVLLGAGP